VIQAGVMLGARSIHFVRSERGEKSYIQSTALMPDAIGEESIKALEQIWDSRAPAVQVHRTFDYFLSHHLNSLCTPDPQSPGSEEVVALLAHPGGRAMASIATTAACIPRRFVLAIGAERGWTDGEVRAFHERGFTMIGLGPRVVRVEIAVCLLMGQIAMAIGDKS